MSLSQVFGWIGERFKHQVVVFAVMAAMAVQGVANLQAQWGIIGEFSNLPQEELLDWIQDNTRPGRFSFSRIKDTGRGECHIIITPDARWKAFTENIT